MARRGQSKSKERIWWWTFYRTHCYGMDGRRNAQPSKHRVWPETTDEVGHCMFPVSAYPTAKHLPVKRTVVPIWPNLTR